MNFVRDTFESIARRKKLAGWLLTLRGPAKLSPQVWLAQWQQPYDPGLANMNQSQAQQFATGLGQVYGAGNHGIYGGGTPRATQGVPMPYMSLNEER